MPRSVPAIYSATAIVICVVVSMVSGVVVVAVEASVTAGISIVSAVLRTFGIRRPIKICTSPVLIDLNTLMASACFMPCNALPFTTRISSPAKYTEYGECELVLGEIHMNGLGVQRYRILKCRDLLTSTILYGVYTYTLTCTHTFFQGALLGRLAVRINGLHINSHRTFWAVNAADYRESESFCTVALGESCLFERKIVEKKFVRVSFGSKWCFRVDSNGIESNDRNSAHNFTFSWVKFRTKEENKSKMCIHDEWWNHYCCEAVYRICSLPLRRSRLRLLHWTPRFCLRTPVKTIKK